MFIGDRFNAVAFHAGSFKGLYNERANRRLVVGLHDHACVAQPLDVAHDELSDEVVLGGFLIQDYVNEDDFGLKAPND